jgi:hypothetical protein
MAPPCTSLLVAEPLVTSPTADRCSRSHSKLSYNAINALMYDELTYLSMKYYDSCLPSTRSVEHMYINHIYIINVIPSPKVLASFSLQESQTIVRVRFEFLNHHVWCVYLGWVTIRTLNQPIPYTLCKTNSYTSSSRFSVYPSRSKYKDSPHSLP